MTQPAHDHTVSGTTPRHLPEHIDRSAQVRSKPRIARLLVVLGLAVQIGVPARQLFRPRQARFGWQMFSDPTPRPVVIAIRAAGEQDTLRVDDYFAFRRGDLSPSYIERLPLHLCRVIPQLQGVVIRRGVRAPAEVHWCR